MKYLLILLVFVLGCLGSQPAPKNPNPYSGLQYLPYTNGLSTNERLAYYYTDEGIQYLPLDVLLSLRRPIDGKLGLYDELLLERPERFGLYPNPMKNWPPIGITMSRDKNYVPMAGINCATCHTSLITYNGRSFLVDGASSLFAVDRFIKEMVLSIANTMANPREFSEFYQRYQARVKAPQGDDELDQFLQSDEYTILTGAINDHLDGKNPNVDNSVKDFLNTTTLTSGAYPIANQLNSGFKMFVYMTKRFIFFFEQTKFAANPDGSTVGDSGLGRANPWSVTKNMLASKMKHKIQSLWPQEVGGPVNTPNIWEFDKSKRIFWTGVTNSMLERNLAQGVALVTDFNWETNETTVSIKGLKTVSDFTKKVEPPVWPELLFGNINIDSAEKGKILFKENCLGCHAASKTEEVASRSYNYIDVGTDPEYYKGQAALFYGQDLFKDVLAPWLSQIKDKDYQREGIFNRELYESGRMNAEWNAPNGNKMAARPLYGIWATPPYLHNGSVPSIRELLKKPGDRVMEFFVGSTEYDPINLGFKNQPLYFSFHFKVMCDNCTGNSNLGHDYGTNFSEEEKYQLIEFLKSYTTSEKF